jgi:histidinol-phosphate phosphatase family protein
MTGSQVAILAGGLGTRLQARTGGLPKPMAPILGKPVLEHLVELCGRNGFDRIALLVHHRHETISEHFGDGSRWGVRLSYHVETEARGTAGALHDALDGLDDRFLVLYGDTYADIDLNAFWRAHAARPAAATLLLHPNDHPQDSDLVEIDDDGAVLALHPYPHDGRILPNLVNAAMYIMERGLIADMLPPAGKADIAKHVFPAILARGQALRGYVTPEYIKDMGTPERLDKVARDIEAGVSDRLSSRALRSAVFLDRDGTINEEVEHLAHPNQLILIEGAGAAVRRLNRSGILAVCVTNQPVIARGDVSVAALRQIHNKLDALLGGEGAYLDRLYYCPHHPDHGFAGEVAELKIACDCRKPGTGMFDRAVRDLAIDRRQSWMIGDRTADIRAGMRSGLRTILLRTGHAGLDCGFSDRPDYVMSDLATAIDWALIGRAKLATQMIGFTAARHDARLILIGGPARSGKSVAAQVLAELMRETGRTVHIIALDGWLRPVDLRQEGGGVAQRYDLADVEQIVASLMKGKRISLADRGYNRQRRVTIDLPARSVGPDDLIIVEGVPALMSPALLSFADAGLFVDADDAVRRTRLLADYRWRGHNPADVEAALAAREEDEVHVVRNAAGVATRIMGE